ncbi:MAG: 23S rRNA (uracil(1939)-C(5))-methyltransferase RlmD [Pseudomonadales bacterium]|nr:23S rRNA (uracil(1939)-C(5))-methyltransferase RlmD [Pseudomonadales bacterium]MBO7005328.1 23S rRNA (uracil(1939)-C(5))-methyltransferase RlmD [Pseudomonadales bacterium]
MKRKEPIVVQVDDVRVDGYGYTADRRYAVTGALPGEEIVGLPFSRQRKKLYLRPQEIRHPSPERVEPACRAAAFCGGCSFQHVSPDYQLTLKESFLRACLAPISPDEWLPPITGEGQQYRTKARLGVKFVEKKGKVLVGFREKLKPYIAENAGCPILIEPIGKLLPSIGKLVEQLSVSDKIPQIELASGDKEIALIFRHLEDLSEDDIECLCAFGAEHGLQILLQPGGLDSTHRIFPESGELTLYYSLPDHDLRFGFSPQDFTQVNLEINRQMVNRALELLALDSADCVFDAFCGIGNFSLAVARYAGRVIGAEQSESSITRARQNGLDNHISNVDFQVLDLHAESLEIKGLEGVNKVLLDPPRSGAERLVKKLASSDIERVVYVSCNPETLARDAKLLVENGFSLRSAGVINMFPHTTHVESVALLVREDKRI